MSQIRPYEMLAWAILLLMVAQLGETLYLPAMPVIAHELNTTTGATQWLLSLFLIGYGAGQFIYGPLSDYYGRRPIVLFGLVGSIIATLLASVATSMTMLLICQAFYACTICVGGLMCRTMLTDLFEQERLQKATAIVGVAIVFTPMAAPVVGAALLSVFGWRSNFLFFAIMGAILLLIFLPRFKETNAYRRQTPLSYKAILGSYKTIISDKFFMGNLICGLLNFGALMSYEVVAPFLFQKHLGFDPMTYAFLSLVPVGGFLVGSILASYLSTRLSPERTTHLANAILLISSFLMFLPIIQGDITAISILIPMALFLLGSGLLFSSTTAAALRAYGAMAGVAGAFLGGLQNLGAGLVTGLMSILEVETLLPLAVVLLATTLIGYAAYCFGERHSASNTQEGITS